MAKVRIPIPTVNEKLLERYIRHSVYMEQLKTGEAKLISRFLKQRTFPRIYQKLISELGKVKGLETLGSIRNIPIRRLRRMLAATQKISTAGMVKAEKMMVDRLVNVSKFEARWNADMISKTVPVDIDMAMPSNEVLRNLVTMRPMDGHKLGTWMKGYSTAVRVAMTKQVKVGIALGESLPAISKRINRALNWKGKQAEAIARTAVSNVVHQAREEVFKRNKDIVRKVQWISTLDDRTSLICIDLDGRMFNVGDGPRPPIHFQCRSTVVPITPSWQEFGVEDPPPATRASMNGAVPAKMNYRQWIAKQPKSVQVKVLGKRRAELYRSGRVKIDRFIGRDLKPLTLKQLARREGLSQDFLPAPSTVKAMPVKGVGKLTSVDKNRLQRYGFSSYENIVKAQLGEPLRREMAFASKSGALVEANKVEKILRKMKGFSGTSYRGLTFKTEVERVAFLNRFKKGGVWKSKSFQSTTKNEWIAKGFAEKKGVILQIRGKSGRNIAKYSEVPGEAEVLFTKGTSFRVDKIVGNKVYLTEITKQAQLKAVPAPPITATKVGTTYAKTTSAEIRKLVDDTINAYPEKVKAALNESGVHYNVGNSLTEINPSLRSRQPIGWSKGSTWDNVAGSYNMGTKSVSVAETYLPRGQKVFATVSKKRMSGVLNHETGHAFDGSISEVYSNSSKFRSAYATDIAKLSKKDIANNNLRFFMQKGIRGRSETFADVFADLMGQGAASKDIRKFFPNSTKYIDDILKAKAVPKVTAKITVVPKVKVFAAPPKVPVVKVSAVKVPKSKLPGAVSIEENYWHVTTKTAARNIKKEGFKILETEVGGKIYGNGIYLGAAGDTKALKFYKSFIPAAKRTVMNIPVKVSELFEITVKPYQSFSKTAAQIARKAKLGLQYKSAKSRILANNAKIRRLLERQPLMSRKLEESWLRQQGLIEYPEGTALQEVLMEKGYKGIKINAKGSFSVDVGGSQIVVYDTSPLNKSFVK